MTILKSTDISVETNQKVVTLSGFVESQAQAEAAVKVAKGVEGVTSVSDKLHVRDNKEGSVKGYAGDTATTSEVKAKLLADDLVPSRKVKVETTDGVVQLSGTVETQEQSDRAESIAKAVDGVKSVKKRSESSVIRRNSSSRRLSGGVMCTTLKNIANE